MIDIAGMELNFRGYPVTVITDGVAARLWAESEGDATRHAKILAGALARAIDTSTPPDEPSDWYFETTIDGTFVEIERFGDPSQWSVFLPGER